jgi:tRNA pseudouridine38-40 synthase
MPKHSYILYLSYLGFRYSGWANNPKQATVQGCLDKTIRYLYPALKFRTLGCGRTDAKVSALRYAAQLVCSQPIDTAYLLSGLQGNLPADISAIDILEAPKGFNILAAAAEKEYGYAFCFGQPRMHPFCSPNITWINDNIDIGIMQQAAGLFAGTHNFRAYCSHPRPGAVFIRNISLCNVGPNNIVPSAFLGRESYIFRVRSSGFLRSQVRLMFWQAALAGAGKICLADIEHSLAQPPQTPLRHIAPASGLVLIDALLPAIPN